MRLCDRLSACACAVVLLASCSAAQQTERRPVDGIRLPAGFRIDVYAGGLAGARSMTRGDGGTIFVGTRESVVYAVRDRDGDGFADESQTILSGLDMPNGVVFHDGALYVGEVSRILRYDGIEKRLDDPPEPAVVRDDFPTSRHHGWKYIRFGPDGKLYVPVGAPCNVCSREDPRFASMTRMNADGSGFEVFAHGIRNTVGFDWHPGTRVLWFTDNGRDQLGDDVPPDELNAAPEAGLHFGFPHCHGNGIPDPEFGQGRDCSEFVEPVQELGPHVASLGMRFYTGTMFPEKWRGRVFIAEHGSWNRSQKIGYRVTTVPLSGDAASAGYEVFAEGWLSGGRVSGRPVDLLVMPDGSLLVSDDEAGAIYRISYAGE